jgi:uncharacterized linocin/CFP29 family protein
MNDPCLPIDSTTSLPYSPVPWSQAQWDRVRQVVAAEAEKSRLAAGFLPLYGPLSADSDFVRRELIGTQARPSASAAGSGPNQRLLQIDDTTTIRLWTLQVNLYLRGPQLADPELTSVLALFRRAANVLARLEDTVVFNGIPLLGDTRSQAEKQLKLLPPIWEILGRSPDDPSRLMPGLLPDSPQPCPGYDPPDSVDPGQGSISYRQWLRVPSPKGEKYGTPAYYADLGYILVGVISQAISRIEANGHYGPFALVLGHGLFEAMQTPNASSLVLPQDRVIPFLGNGGTLLRSSTLPVNQGVIMALGGDPVDLVIAKDISVDFLQITPDPAYVFRLHERMVLRIMTPGAICGLRLFPDPASDPVPEPVPEPAKSAARTRTTGP